MTSSSIREAKIKPNPIALIAIISFLVPALVFFLYYATTPGKLGFDTSILPRLNAVLNSMTAVVLVVGFIFIKNGKRKQHRFSMVTAFVLSSMFFVSYLVYHASSGHFYFGDANFDGILTSAEKNAVYVSRLFYCVILISHIILAMVIVPFVLLSVYLGWSKKYALHKKISKWTFPLWLYVSVSGVIVYLMISPYYY